MRFTDELVENVAEHEETLDPQSIPVGLLRTVPLPVVVTVSAFVPDMGVNAAVKVRLDVIVTLQSIMRAVQPPPLQPAKLEPGLGLAPRLSVAPLARVY